MENSFSRPRWQRWGAQNGLGYNASKWGVADEASLARLLLCSQLLNRARGWRPLLYSLGKFEYLLHILHKVVNIKSNDYAKRLSL